MTDKSDWQHRDEKTLRAAEQSLQEPAAVGGDGDETMALPQSADAAAQRTSSPDDPTDKSIKTLQVAGYEIIELIGRGGMGVVYKARDLRLKRMVALKMILAGEHAGEEHLRRFRSEAETIARLHHSNIVQIYDVGEQDGYPFLSLEFVDGMDLAKFTDGQPQQPRVAAELVEAMAHAMHYAHQQGVVHRDLKPSNVLLGVGANPASRNSKLSGKNSSDWQSRVAASRSHVANQPTIADAKATTDTSANSKTPQHTPELEFSVGSSVRGVSSIASVDGQLATSAGLIPKITDFGLAKQLDSDGELTSTGQILGTAYYMAPEQADGRISDIGPCTDIYALGAILYTLLTGRPPFQGTSLLDTLHMVRHDEPVPPTQFQRRLSKDLETICLKCLQKDPSRRYTTSGDLADELRRFISDEPILARPVSRTEKAVRWCRRNPAVASLISACALLFVVGFVLVSWKWSEAADAHQEVSRQLLRVQVAVNTAVEAEARAGKERDLSLQREAELTFHEGRRLAEQGEVARGCLWMLRSLQILDGIQQQSNDAELQQKITQWQRLARFNLGSWIPLVPEIVQVHAQPVPLAMDAFLRTQDRRTTRGAVSANGINYALADGLGRVSLFNSSSGKLLAKPVQLQQPAIALGFAPDGHTVAVGLSRDLVNAPTPNYAIFPTSVFLFDLRTGEQLGSELPHQDHVFQVRFTIDGGTLVTESERYIRTWDVASGKMLCETVVDETVRGLDLNAENDLLLVRTNRYEPLYDLESLQPSSRAKSLGGRAITFYPDGESILVSTETTTENASTLQLVDIVSGLPRGVKIRSQFGFEKLHRDDWSFTPDGQYLLGICGDDSIRTWDVTTGRLLGSPIRVGKWNEPYETSADGRWVISEKWLARMLRVQSRPSIRLDQAPVEGTPNLESASGRGPSTVAYAANFDSNKPSTRVVLTRPYGFQNTHRVTALKDALNGQPHGPPLTHQGNHIRAVAVSPDGTLAATANHIQTVVGGWLNIWDTKTGAKLWGPLPHSNWIPVLAFSPDNRIVAAGDYHGFVRFWDTQTGEEAREPFEHNEIVFSLAFDSAGDRLAVGTTSDRNNAPHCRVWDFISGQPLAPPLPHEDWVHWVQFSPDGSRLLTATDRGTRLWDGRNYQQIGELVPTGKPLLHFAWRPDSTMFATCTEEGQLRVHDGDSGEVIGRMSHPRAIHCLAFSPDGQILAAGTEDGSTRLWDVTTQQPLAPPFVQTSPVYGITFDNDGRSVASTSRDGTTRIWPIPLPVAGNPDRVARRIELWTGMHWGDERSLSRLTVYEWEKRKLQFDTQPYPDPLTSPLSDTDWHLNRAADAEQDRNGFAAVWHLTRLSALHPDEWPLQVRMARALMWRGDYQAAEAAMPANLNAVKRAALNDWLLHALANERIRGDTKNIEFLGQVLDNSREL